MTDPRFQRPKFVGGSVNAGQGNSLNGAVYDSEISGYNRYTPADQSRMYIPMSQKGTRANGQYYGVQGGQKQLNAAMAMKIMYNQPSQAGGLVNASANYHVHGGGVSRPSWWG